MKELDDAFGFTRSGNAEIQCDWFLHCIAHQYRAADSFIERFLMHVGRRKFLKPIYAAMAKTPEGRERALAIYRKARPGYHAVSSHTIDDILSVEQPELH